MKTDKKFLFEHFTEVRVRYGETDQMGYCYYGNYAQILEVGRVEAMRKVGMSYKELEEQGVMLPVSTFSIKYIAPAYYDDLLTVQTFIIAVKGVRLFFEYRVLNEKNKLISEAETTLVFVDKKTMKPISPPDSFMTILSTINTR